MKPLWLLYYQQEREQSGQLSLFGLIITILSKSSHVALALYLSIKRVLHFSKYKEEHPEEKLEDGEIMNKVRK